MGNTNAGMSRNPFGGCTRLDRLDLMEFLPGGHSSEKVIFLETIADALHNYLFFGLGKNGTTIQEFAWAYDYLFLERSSTVGNLTDSQSGFYFDTHYDLAGMSFHRSMDRFLVDLKKKRRKIVQDNIAQVHQYLGDLYEKACVDAAPGQLLPLPLQDRLEVLVEPKDQLEIARLIYLPSRYMEPPTYNKRSYRR